MRVRGVTVGGAGWLKAWGNSTDSMVVPWMGRNRVGGHRNGMGVGEERMMTRFDDSVDVCSAICRSSRRLVAEVSQVKAPAVIKRLVSGMSLCGGGST